MAIIINGKEISRKKREAAAERCFFLKQKGITPCLAVILAGDDPASISYITAKEKALIEAGMESKDIRLPRNVSEETLLEIIEGLNTDPLVHGILVQLPLPPHIRENIIITAINPAKDVDGFHPISAGNLLLGRPGFLPCTPLGILVLLETMNIPVSGTHVVIVGRSNIVGKPLANLLIRRDYNASVTICHTGSGDLGYYTRQADILIVAAGRPGLIGADMVKKGAAVIDVGLNRVPDNSVKKGYKLVGDIDFDAVEPRVKYITPAPGGVGPMTIALLLQNVLDAAQTGST